MKHSFKKHVLAALLLMCMGVSVGAQTTSYKFDDWTVQTYGEETTQGNLTINNECVVEQIASGSSRSVMVDGRSESFTNFLKLPGTPTTTTRFIKFPVTGASKITVVYSRRDGGYGILQAENELK